MAKKPSRADVLRLGAEVANAKAGTKPKDWRKFVTSAHDRGFTVAGALSSSPDALKERTRSSLAKQAATTVGSAYESSAKDLDSEESKAKALNSKRKQDEAAYSQWAATQHGALMTNAQAADQTLASQQAQNHAALAGQWQELAQKAAGNVQAAPGTVSNMGNSTALQGVQNAAAMSAQQASAQDAYLTNRTQSSQARLAAYGASNAAASQANLTKADSDMNDAMSKVASARTKMNFDKSGDIEKEVARLGDLEVTKATTRGEQDMAAEQLNLKSFQAHQDALDAARDDKLASAKFDLDSWKAKHTDAYNQAKIEMGYASISSREGQAKADRDLKTWLQKQKNRQNALDRADGGGTSAGGAKASSEAITKVSRLQAELRRLTTKTGNPARARELLRQRGASDIEMDVANDLNARGGRLGPNGVKKAESIGIIVPSYWR